MTGADDRSETMFAVALHRHGGPEVLRGVRLPVPVPQAGEALVRNAWIGVNYVDLQHRAGTPYPVPLPLIPGTEASGTVRSVGPGVPADLVGRRVVHLGHLAGVYAEYTAVPLAHLVPLDDDTPQEIAAAVAMAGSTAHVLTREATSVSGAVVVVHAAAGSTGGAVVQLAAAEGAHVVAITSTRAKAGQALRLGAHDAIARSDEVDLVGAVRRLTGGGAHLVFDATGRETFTASLDMLAAGGTLVLYGAVTGHPEPFAPQQLSGLDGTAGRNGSLGVRWVAATDYLTGATRARAVRAVLDDVRKGRLEPRIEARLPLAEAAQAHRLLAGRTVSGKLLLHTGG